MANAAGMPTSAGMPNSDGMSSSRDPLHATKSLYEVLGIEKDATDDDIKRAYRKLALRYHPDKNLDGDPEKTEKFKEINHANSILSDPNKKKVYDMYGDVGLKMIDQMGDKYVGILTKRWMKWFVFIFSCLSCCCFGCCCCCMCCCNCCCGRFAPKHAEDTEYYMSRENAPGEDSIQNQPQSSSTTATMSTSPIYANGTRQHTVIVLGPPPSSPANNYGATECEP